MQIARWFHLVGVVIWVGGMFFAQMALRPSLGLLAPPVRLPFLAATLRRFFAAVGVAIVLILGSGIAMIVMLGGMGGVPWWVHAMTGLGILMMLIFGHLAMGPFRRLRAAVAANDWGNAAAQTATIRLLVNINLVLGFIVLTVAVLGR